MLNFGGVHSPILRWKKNFQAICPIWDPSFFGNGIPEAPYWLLRGWEGSASEVIPGGKTTTTSSTHRQPTNQRIHGIGIFT